MSHSASLSNSPTLKTCHIWLFQGWCAYVHACETETAREQQRQIAIAFMQGFLSFSSQLNSTSKCKRGSLNLPTYPKLHSLQDLGLMQGFSHMTSLKIQYSPPLSTLCLENPSFHHEHSSILHLLVPSWKKQPEQELTLLSTFHVTRPVLKWHVCQITEFPLHLCEAQVSYYLHFTEENIEAQRSKVTCLGWQIQDKAELKSKCSNLVPGPAFLTMSNFWLNKAIQQSPLMTVHHRTKQTRVGGLCLCLGTEI